MSSAESRAPAQTPLRGFFASRDGLQLYHEIWPAAAPVRGLILFVHGFGEHCGRYGWPIEHLGARGFDAVAFDTRGHGQAAGARGHCYHFEEYLGDLDAALALAAQRAGGKPIFLLGHSHGGLVAVRYLLGRPERAQELRGLVLTSPFFGLAMKVPAAKLAAGRLVSRVLPRLAMKTNIPAEHLSHERSVVEGYGTDRWVHGVATARWFTCAMEAQRYCLEHAGELGLPVLLCLAGEDRVASTPHSRALFDALRQKDKKLIVYPGFYHEVMNETGRAQVFADIGAWLEGRLESRPPAA